MKHKKFARKCSCCENGMNAGFVINNGDDYFCSEACLESKMTYKKYLKLYDDGNSDTYYTEWIEHYDYQFEEIDGILTEIK